MHSFLEMQLLTLVRSIAQKVAKKFNLKYRRIELFPIDDPDRKKSRGICYPDGFIYVGVRRRLRGRVDTLDSITDTIIHELAHLKYFNHGRSFWAFHKKMKQWYLTNLY